MLINVPITFTEVLSCLSKRCGDNVFILKVDLENGSKEKNGRVKDSLVLENRSKLFNCPRICKTI